MDNNQYWHELLPLYVEGRLSPQERHALEQQLYQDPALQEAYEEWRLLAAVVQEEAARWAAKPPPLSASFKANLPPRGLMSQATQPNQRVSQEALNEATRVTRLPSTPQPSPPGYEPTTIADAYGRQPRKIKQGRPLSLSMAAAAILMILFSGFIVYVIVNGTSDEDNEGGSNLSQVNGVASETADVAEATLFPTPTVTPFGGGNFVPTALPTNTIQALAPNSGGGLPTATTDDSISSMETGPVFSTEVPVSPAPSLTPIVTPEIALSNERCVAQISDGQALDVLANPYGNAIRRQMLAGELWPVKTVTVSGWYEVISPDFDGTSGWLFAGDIILMGDCSIVPRPSATIASGVQNPDVPSDPSNPNATLVPQVSYFSPSTTTVYPGDTLTLSWSVRGAEALWIEQSPNWEGGDPLTFEPDARFSDLPLTGSIEVSIPVDYEADIVQFSLIMNQIEWVLENGYPVRGPGVSLTIPIIQGAVEITRFEANRSSAAPGDTITLNFAASGATEAYITPYISTDNPNPSRETISTSGVITFSIPEDFLGEMSFRFEVVGRSGQDAETIRLQIVDDES